MYDTDDPFPSFLEDEGDLEGSTNPHLSLVDLETVLNRPPSRRKRLAQVGVWLVALMVLLGTFRSVLLSRPPAPPATVTPAAARVLSITSNVSSGTLTINGRVQRAALPLQVALTSTARLSVTLAAPPFRPLTCTVPPAPAPPGTFNPCLLSGYAPPTYRAVVALSLLLGLEALPPLMQQQVLAGLKSQANFQADTTVPSGWSIPTGLTSVGGITSQVTMVPLQARARLTPSPQDLLEHDPSCDERLCYAPLAAAVPSTPLWALALPVVLDWRFTNAAGQVVSDVGYPVLEGWPVDLSYDQRTGWQAAPTLDRGTGALRQLAVLVCATGAALVQAQVANQSWTITGTDLEGIEGCGLVGQQEEQVPPVFVWRFGVLFVVNVPAQRLLPGLPLVPPATHATPGG